VLKRWLTGLFLLWLALASQLEARIGLTVNSSGAVSNSINEINQA